MTEDIYGHESELLGRAKASLKRHDPINQGFYTSMPFEDVQIWKELIAEVEANQILLRQFQVHEDQTHAAMEGLLGNSDNFIELASEMKEEVGRLQAREQQLKLDVNRVHNETMTYKAAYGKQAACIQYLEDADGSNPPGRRRRSG